MKKTPYKLEIYKLSDSVSDDLDPHLNLMVGSSANLVLTTLNYPLIKLKLYIVQNTQKHKFKVKENFVISAIDCIGTKREK